ncbi:unnamed protein product [Hapterophycus canaliculatus]
MGFDSPNDETVRAKAGNESQSERLKDQWREIEEENRKTAGGREEEEEEEGALPEPDAEGRRMAESEEVKTLSEVLARSCHFLATPSLETQATALACIRDCVVKLSTAGADAALLPHVHRAWRPLMASLREHLTPLPDTLAVRRGSHHYHGDGSWSSLSSRRAVLLHALDTVDALVDVCGDFLASKVSEDLWPLLKLLLLQYAAFKTAGRSSSIKIAGAGKQLQLGRAALFSSASSSSASPSSEGLLLVGNNLEGSAGFSGSGNSGGGGGGSLSCLLAVPPRGPTEGGSSAVEERPASNRGRDSGGRAIGTLGEKVVARALKCLEKLCSSQQCERFMTPLAREVALAALPCLSSAGVAAIRSRAEALFRRLSFLDGDSVWLLLLQTMDTSVEERHTTLLPPQQQQQRQRQQRQRQRFPLSIRAPATGRGNTGAGSNDDTAGRGAGAPEAAALAAAAGPSRPPAGGPSLSGGETSAGPSSSATGSLWWLPDASSPQAVALPGISGAGGAKSRRPAALLELRSFLGDVGDGQAARECAPAAERLMASLRVDGATTEHM